MKHTTRPYEGTKKKAKEVVDEAWEAIAAIYRKHGYKADVKDPAERLVDELFNYLKVSNPGEKL